MCFMHWIYGPDKNIKNNCFRGEDLMRTKAID